MTAEVSQQPPSVPSSDIPNAPNIPLDSNPEKVEETGRSLFRKISISLGGRKNSTKSADASEGKNESVVGSVSSSSSSIQTGSDTNASQQKSHHGESAQKPNNAAEPELYLKSGDYQEGDSSALLDFETAAATSTPVGPNSVADDSRDSVSGGEAVKDEAKGVRRKSSTTSTASFKKDNKEKSSKSPSLGDNVNNNNDDENKTSDDDNPPDNEQSQIADNVLNNNKNNNSGIKNNTGDVKKDPTSGAPKGKRLSKAVQKRGENLLHRQVYSRARLKGVPSRNQEQRVGLTSDEERETDTFRETFNDIHETSVVDLRAAAFLNRSAPDLNSAGGDSSRLSYSESRKLNNTASNLSVGRSRYGHSLHDLNGESVASYNQRRSKYRDRDIGDDVVDVAPIAGGKSSTRRRVILKKSKQSNYSRHKSSAIVKTTRVSLIDESAGNVHYSGEEIAERYKRSSSATPTRQRAPPRGSSMSLSIAVSVKEIEDTPTQTNASGDDGSDSEGTTPANGAATTGIENSARAKTSGETEKTENREIAADEANRNQSSQSDNEEANAKSVDNDKVDGHIRAVSSPVSSVPILDSEGNEVGDIEVGVANSVEEMLSTVHAVTSAIADSVNTVSQRIEAEEANANKTTTVSSPTSKNALDDNIGVETPGTDIVGFGNYESDVTTPGLEQTIEVSVDSTPENKFNDDETSETKDEESTEESEFLLSAISERGESALPTSEDLETEIENRGRAQEGHHEHPGDHDDEESIEDPGVVFIDNGQTVSRESSQTTVSPSPSAVAQRGTAITRKTFRADSDPRSDSASSRKTPMTANRKTASATSRSSRESPAQAPQPLRRNSRASPNADGSAPSTPGGEQRERKGSKSGSTQPTTGQETRTVTPADSKPPSAKSPPLPRTRRSIQSNSSGSGNSISSAGRSGPKNTSSDGADAKPSTPETSSPRAASRGASSGSNSKSPSNRSSRRGSRESVDRSSVEGESSRSAVDAPTVKSSQSPKSISPKGSKTTSPKGSKSSSTKTSRSGSGESSRPTSARARKTSGSGIAREGTYVKQSDDSPVSPGLLESAKAIVEETVEKAARSFSASLHSASMSREDSKSLTTSEDVVTVVEAPDRTESRLSNDTVIIEKGDDPVEGASVEPDVGVTSATTNDKIDPTHTAPGTDGPTKGNPLETNADSAIVQPKNTIPTAEIGNSENGSAEAQKQSIIAANADSAQIMDDTDSTGLRTPDSKATTLDDSMSLPNDSGHATEEDRGSSPDIRGSDIIAAVTSDPHSDSASSKKSTRTIKRAPKDSAPPVPPVVPVPKATARTRKSPARSRRNKSPPPPEKYLNRLKRSKSEGVSLHKLQAQSDQSGSRVNSRASEGGEGRLSRLQSKSVAEIEQQRHEEMEKLRAKLDSLRSERQECEVQKEEMVKHVRGLHAKLIQEKEAVQEIWRKRYLDEKKLTPKLEEDSAKWRQELERIHKDMITKVEGRDPSDARSPFSRLEEPSNKVSYKIMVARLLQEIEDLKRRLETTKLRLSAEAKLRAMAEKDVRTLREDLIQKKIQVTLTRKETDSVIAPFYRDTIYSMHPLI